MPDAMPMPPAMARRAAEFRGRPAPPRAAATVVLLRPPLEVYLQQRHATMVFGGQHAFPGGGVDLSDRPTLIRNDWATRLGVSAEAAAAVVGAAARELFEEAGVLLAGPVEQPDRTVGDVSTPDWETDRAAVAQHEMTLAGVLQRRGLRLRDDLLLPWTRWLTPEFEARRFDTWFFVALLPDGQTARDVSGEASRTTWISPEAANGLAMLPPTRSMLDDVRAYSSLDEIVAASAHRDASGIRMPHAEGEVLILP